MGDEKMNGSNMQLNLPITKTKIISIGLLEISQLEKFKLFYVRSVKKTMHACPVY